MKFLLLLALVTASHATTVATIDVYAGSLAGNPADTFTRLGTSGGFGPSGTRIGLASTTAALREIAGTSNTTA